MRNIYKTTGILALLFVQLLALGQSPYDSFDKKQCEKHTSRLPEMVFRAESMDTTDIIRYVELDIETLQLKCFSANDSLLAEIQLKQSDVKFISRDPKFEKYFGTSPYAYCLNNPVSAVDPDGEEVYMLFYTIGNNRGNGMFYAAALTRQRDIMESKSFNPQKDIVVLMPITDLGTIGNKVSSITKKYSEKYGKTAEFSIWSHAGIDGPIGTVTTSENILDGKQMSIKGWGKIDFNWGQDAVANFFGCRTGVFQDGVASFVTRLSAQSNFKDVKVSGQTSSSYPSSYTNYRENSDFGDDTFGYYINGNTYFSQTYMVGGIRRNQDWNGNEQNIALPMRTSMNGKNITTTHYQDGESK